MTLAEIFTKAITNTILGMGVVFSVLIFISFLISLFKYLPGLIAHFNKEKKHKEEPVVDEPEIILGSQPTMDADVLLAVITAAISATIKDNEPTGDAYFVRTIRRA